MSRSTWSKTYEQRIAAEPAILFDLLADLPNYPSWLPASDQYGGTTDVEPYPVQLGTRYHDGKPGEGRSWWGSVIVFSRPTAIAFSHVIAVRPLHASVDATIQYSIGSDSATTHVRRALILDITMPLVLRPLRPLIVGAFDRENLRTLEALKGYAERSGG